jgi:hypothetical protein
MEHKLYETYESSLLGLCKQVKDTIAEALNWSNDNTESGLFESIVQPGTLQEHSDIYFAALLVINKINRKLGKPAQLEAFKNGGLEGSPFIRLQYLVELNEQKALAFFEENDSEKKVKLLVEGLFCSHEFIRGMNQYGGTYNIMQSQLGEMHRRMAFWCKEYHEMKKDSESLDKKVSSYFGREYPGQRGLNEEYHLRMSIQHYYYAIHTHTENQHYNSIISEMYFLEDDFNDNLYHFCAALERVLMNGTYLRKVIDHSRERLRRITTSHPKA